jgi:tetratricopeptide repeat protein
MGNTVSYRQEIFPNTTGDKRTEFRRLVLTMDIEQFAAQYGIRDEDPGRLSALAINAYKRHMQSGSTEDIDIAIALAKQGIYRTANDNLSLIGRLNKLGIFLCRRYERTGEMKDLEEAIQTARQVVESTRADHPDQAAWLNNLGIMLSRRLVAGMSGRER